MPNAHNGYLDTMVEMGYVGYALLLAFIIATLHAIGRIADRAPVRAWLVLSLAVHIIITNGLESLWMRGFEMLWIVFLILAAEAARYWKRRRRRAPGMAQDPAILRPAHAQANRGRRPVASCACRKARPRRILDASTPNRRSRRNHADRPRARLSHSSDFDGDTTARRFQH